MSVVRIIAIIVFVGVSVVAKAGENSLPQLSSVGFITGRPATEADVKAGNAVFVLKDGETPIGVAMDIKLPQYAYFIDNGVKTPVVVIQAEGARGRQLMGAINSMGTPIAGFRSDFELLGASRP